MRMPDRSRVEASATSAVEASVGPIISVGPLLIIPRRGGAPYAGGTSPGCTNRFTVLTLTPYTAAITCTPGRSARIAFDVGIDVAEERPEFGGPALPSGSSSPPKVGLSKDTTNHCRILSHNRPPQSNRRPPDTSRPSP